MTTKEYNFSFDGESTVYTTITRPDGKIVITADETYEHIGMHASVGTGSVFSGGITPDLIQGQISTVSIPKGGGGVQANFPGGGYLLVAPFDVAMQFPDATTGSATKEDRGQPVEVTAVHTTAPISQFKTDITTMLIFGYNPKFSDPKTNAFVESETELSQALENGQLYMLATAFPGGFDIDEVGGIKFKKQTVPRSTEWGGTENPTWAVIIPDSTGNSVVERWNALAGTVL